jgi:hypothetical protein
MPSRRIIVIAHEVKQRANLPPAGSFRRSPTSRREPGLWVRSSSFPSTIVAAISAFPTPFQWDNRVRRKFG